MSTKKKADPKDLAAAADLLADGSVTVAGLKTEYGVGRSVAYELMNSGELPFTQFNKRRLIPRRAIKQLLASRLVGGSAGKRPGS
ncbi:MAG: helix-turn-helix domain-containing protein [Gemmataceae bacterium]